MVLEGFFGGRGRPKFTDAFFQKMHIAQKQKMLLMSLGRNDPFPHFPVPSHKCEFSMMKRSHNQYISPETASSCVGHGALQKQNQ